MMGEGSAAAAAAGVRFVRSCYAPPPPAQGTAACLFLPQCVVSLWLLFALHVHVLRHVCASGLVFVSLTGAVLSAPELYCTRTVECLVLCHRIM